MTEFANQVAKADPALSPVGHSPVKKPQRQVEVPEGSYPPKTATDFPNAALVVHSPTQQASSPSSANPGFDTAVVRSRELNAVIIPAYISPDTRLHVTSDEFGRPVVSYGMYSSFGSITLPNDNNSDANVIISKPEYPVSDPNKDSVRITDIQNGRMAGIRSSYATTEVNGGSVTVTKTVPLVWQDTTSKASILSSLPEAVLTETISSNGLSRSSIGTYYENPQLIGNSVVVNRTRYLPNANSPIFDFVVATPKVGGGTQLSESPTVEGRIQNVFIAASPDGSSVIVGSPTSNQQYLMNIDPNGKLINPKSLSDIQSAPIPLDYITPNLSENLRNQLGTDATVVGFMANYGNAFNTPIGGAAQPLAIKDNSHILGTVILSLDHTPPGGSPAPVYLFRAAEVELVDGKFHLVKTISPNNSEFGDSNPFVAKKVDELNNNQPITLIAQVKNETGDTAAFYRYNSVNTKNNSNTGETRIGVQSFSSEGHSMSNPVKIESALNGISPLSVGQRVSETNFQIASIPPSTALNGKTTGGQLILQLPNERNGTVVIASIPASAAIDMATRPQY